MQKIQSFRQEEGQVDLTQREITAARRFNLLAQDIYNLRYKFMVKHLSKGQVSLEYLMTYGIAIAIVVIAVAALYSMNVFTPKTSTPPCVTCFGGDFVEASYNAATGNVKLALNNGPEDLSNMACIGCTITSNGAGTPITSVPANGAFVLNITGDSTNGANIQLNYTRGTSPLITTRNQTIAASYFK